jgi:signal transduction histidine kinase
VLRHWIQRVLLSGWLALLSLLVVSQFSRAYAEQQRSVIATDSAAAIQTSADSMSNGLAHARRLTADAATILGGVRAGDLAADGLESLLVALPGGRCAAIWDIGLSRDAIVGDCTSASLVWSRTGDRLTTPERGVVSADGEALVLLASALDDQRTLLVALDVSALADETVYVTHFNGHRFAVLLGDRAVWRSSRAETNIPDRAVTTALTGTESSLMLASWPRLQVISAVVNRPVGVIWLGGGTLAALLGGLVFAAQRAAEAEASAKSEILIRKEQDEELETLNRELEERVASRTFELERSNQDLEQLAYVASHDLQEPLRMVVSYLQLLDEEAEAKLSEREREYVHFAIDGARRLRVLVRGLLQYSRVGSHGAEFEWLALEDVVQDALNGLALQVRERGAEVRYSPLPRIFGDPTQLVMVFRNLIANSIKYSEGEPNIWISAEETRVNYTFRVRDDGIGIPEEHRKKVFRLFQRLHTRERYPGTGIGLALVKRIVDRHNGTIRIESPSTGCGTCVVFALPRGVVHPFDTAAAIARENAAMDA